jgi:O-antigen/teichoic acid export membrane protein
MDQLLIREVAALVTNCQWPLVRGLLRMTTWSTLLASLSLTLIGSALIWVLRERWAIDVVRTFWVSLLLLPLISLTRVRQGALQGLRRVVLGSIPERLIQPVLFLALIGAAYWTLHRLTPPLAMGLNVAAALAAFVIGAHWLHKAVPPAVRSADAAYRNSVWMRSAFSMLMVSSVSIVFSQADLLILGAFKGATAVGLYSVADRGADLLTVLMVAQNGAFASTAAALYAARDLDRLQRLATKIARWNLIVAIPPTAIVVLFGHWILLYVYGAEFTSARQALTILSLGQFVNIAMGLNTLLLMMTGNESRAASALFGGAAVNIVLNLLLVPGWGMEGAAIGNLCSIVCWNILATRSLRRVTGIRSTVFAANGRVSA